MARDWHYAMAGASTGPVTEEEMRRVITSGRVSGDVLVWAQGMTDWRPADTLPEFAGLSRPPAPPAGGEVPPVILPAPAAPARAEANAGAGRGTPWPAPNPAALPPSGAPQLGRDGLYIGAPSRGFTEAISVCFRKYITFSGRASRSEYWFFTLFCLIGNFIAGAIDGVLIGFGGGVQAFGGLFSLVILLPSLAVMWRRLHDTDRSGWWIGLGFLVFGVLGTVAVMAAFAGGGGGIGLLFGLASLIYGLTILVFTCQKGNPGPNRFG